MKASRALALALLAGVFLIATWRFGAVSGPRNSPDETANAFWAERVAAGQPLFVADALLPLAAGEMHPRSFAVAGDRLLPGSFPGLFLLYGSLNGLLRLPLDLLTPLFTAAAGLLLYRIWKRVFDDDTALMAAALFYLHPAVLYYSARGLFHNMLFVDAAIFAAWCLIERPFAQAARRLPLSELVGGAALGWAIATRASEAVWLIPAAAACLPLLPKDERFRRAGSAALGAALAIGLLFAFNAAIYGSPGQFAYSPPAAADDPAPAPVPFYTRIGSALLPFGFHPRNMFAHVRDYGLALFWWYSLAIAAGAFWVFASWKRWARPARSYALITLAVAAWLAVYYGSWRFHDHIDPARVTIGTSYTRYFLPAYVLALPAAAAGVLFLARRVGRARFAPTASILLLIVMAILSVRFTAFEGDESLAAVRYTLTTNAVKKNLLLQAIPPGAVVMTERSDKLLFPERPRIIPSTAPSAFAAAARLVEVAEVRYYGLEPGAEEAGRLTRLAEERGLLLVEEPWPIAGETLMRFEKKNPDDATTHDDADQ